MNNHHTHHIPDARECQSAPTKPQLKLLRELADERGESFVMPRTSTQAKGEIERLLKRKPMRHSDRRRDERFISDRMAAGRGDAAAVDHDYETRGWGSSARWA